VRLVHLDLAPTQQQDDADGAPDTTHAMNVHSLLQPGSMFDGAGTGPIRPLGEDSCLE
jgi:hypothetical protein